MADLTAGTPGVPAAEPGNTDLGVLTIPAVVERAAERFGEHEALVDGERRLTFADLAAAADQAAAPSSPTASSPATGSPSGRPTSAEWVIAALGAFRAGAVRRDRQHPVQGRRGRPRPPHRRRPAAGHRHRLPRHRLRRRCSTAAGTPATASSRRRAARARSPTAPIGWDDFLAARRGRRPRGRPPSGPRAISPDDVVHDHLHVGHHRRAQGRHAAPRRLGAGVRRLVRRGRAARGRPLPDRQPVLPLLRAQGRHPRLPRQGGDDRAPPRVRRAAA